MSGTVKGTRKPKGSTNKNIASPEPFQLKPGMTVAILVAIFYALFLIEALLSGSGDALLLSGFAFVALLVFSYMNQIGARRGQPALQSLNYVFVGLSVLPLAWATLRYFNVPDQIGTLTPQWSAFVGLVFAAVSFVVIAVLIRNQKISMKSIAVQVGDKKILGYGIIGLVACLIIGVLAAYFVFGGNALPSGQFPEVVGAVLFLGLAMGAAEELWFRGLMLARATELFDESQGNIYQAAVFGAFETTIFYILTQQADFLPVMFIIGAFMGYYWGLTVRKYKSLAAPWLLHAGFYLILGLPLMTGILPV